MLTIELSSHSHLLTACGNTSHNGPAAKSTTGPQSLFSRDDRPTVTFRPCTVLRNKHSRVRPGSNPPGVARLGSFRNYKSTDRRSSVDCAQCAQFRPNRRSGSFFQLPVDRSSVHKFAQTCTNLYRARARAILLTPTIASPLSRIGFVPQKPCDQPPENTSDPSNFSSVRPPGTGPYFVDLFEI